MKWQDLAAQLHNPIPHPALSSEEMCKHLAHVSAIREWQRTLAEIRALPEAL